MTLYDGGVIKINTKTNEDVYKVKDLYEASFIYASNIPLIRLEQVGNSYFFVFANKEACETARDDFWSYNTSIDAKRLTDAIKSLKERLFSNGR